MVIDFQRKVLKGYPLVHLREQNHRGSVNLKTSKKQQCPSGLIFEGSEYDHVLCNTPSSGFSMILITFFTGYTKFGKDELGHDNFGTNFQRLI